MLTVTVGGAAVTVGGATTPVLGDRMSTFGQARRPWLHWHRPSLAAYPGGHVGFFWSKADKEHVVEAMTATFPLAA